MITQTADFGHNSDKTRQFKIEVKNNLESVIWREQNQLGEKLKANLTGLQVGQEVGKLLCCWYCLFVCLLRCVVEEEIRVDCLCYGMANDRFGICNNQRRWNGERRIENIIIRHFIFLTCSNHNRRIVAH